MLFLTCLLRNGLRATKHHKALFRHLNCQKWSETVQPIPALRNLTSKCASYHKGVHFWNISTSKSAPGMVRFALRNVFCTTTAWTFWTSQLTKSFQTRSVFNIVASKRASRHNRVHFLNISSNSALGMVCFAHFDFEMCFSPQRRILFPHFNFQECSENGVFCTYYWLENAFGATRACIFSSLISPDGSAPAALASLPSTLRSPKNLEKHSVSLSFLGSSFSLSLLCLFPPLLVHLPIYCRKFDLTSKFPSAISQNWEFPPGNGDYAKNNSLNREADHGI